MKRAGPVQAINVDTAAGPVGGLRRVGSGPSLVCIHGAGGNADTWEHVLSAWDPLDLPWDVWCPDLPGRGGTAGSACESAGDTAQWLAHFLAAAAVERPFVLGHSFGGTVALELAISGSPPLAGVILVATGARLRVAPAILEAAASAAVHNSPMATGFAFAPGTARATIASYGAAAQRTPPQATASDWQASNRFDRMDALADVACPALVVHGDADYLTPVKYHRHLTDHLPTATRVEIAGSGHMLPWERPVELARALQGWLAQLP